MQLLNKMTDYAVRALIVVAMGKNTWVSSTAIAKNQGIPLRFVRRTLQNLSRAGLLDTKEGKTGGVRLKKEPEFIKVSDVLRSIQGDIKISECMYRDKVCPERARCVLRARLSRIEENLIREFDGITIQALVDDIGGSK